MQKNYKSLAVLAAVLVAGLLIVATAAAQDADAARKARILANLKLAYPQLEKMNVVMGELGPSGYEGLDEGSFVIQGPRTQTQRFFVSADDKKLYLVSGEPIDVSRTEDDIQAELAKRKEEEAQAAAQRRADLEGAIAGQPMRGNPDGKVTIVEFSDFQCPYCSRGANTVEQILEKHGDDVKFVFKHFPLGFHPWAKPAAIASHCASQQSHEAFWTLHDQYFKNQKAINPQNVLEKSREYLAGTGVDMPAWTACAEDKDSAEYQAASATVEADMALGQKLGVSGTPGFFVNGQFLNGAQPLAAFEPLIAAAKNES